MKTIKGDLITLALKGKFEVIIQGCNCLNTMGAGIAKQIKKAFPEAYYADLETLKGDRNKLGDYTAAIHKTKYGELIIINAYIQYNYRGKNPIDYDAIKKVFRVLSKDLDVPKFSEPLIIGIPKIGAGLAGGDWEKIKKIINREAKNLNITTVLLQ